MLCVVQPHDENFYTKKIYRGHDIDSQNLKGGTLCFKY